MKICIISQEYPPETGGGGIGTYAYNLAHGLAKKGNIIHVISRSHFRSSSYKDENVYIHRIYINQKLSNLFGKSFQELLDRFFRSYFVFRKFIKLNKGIQFDIVEIPEFYAEGFFLVSKFPRKIVTRLHCPSFLTKVLEDKEISKRNQIIEWLEKKQTKKSVKIYSPSNALKNVVSKRWNISKEKISVIPHPFELKKIKNDRSIYQKTLKNSRYILYFGRIERGKGILVLSASMKEVFRNFKDISLVLVGRDMGFKEIVFSELSDFKDRIVYINQISHSQLYPIISNAYLVVLPSLWEGFGYVALEAMAFGKVVIATAQSGFSEIIEDQKSGFLVEPNDVDSLANTIMDCLLRKDLKKIGEAARMRTVDFNRKIIIDKITNLYEEILNENSPCA